VLRAEAVERSAGKLAGHEAAGHGRILTRSRPRQSSDGLTQNVR
jgi:hypothetical protein